MVGVLDIQSREPGAFDENDRSLFEALAAPVAVAMRNANLYRSEQWRRKVAESFRDVAYLQAVMVANIKPGVKLKSLLNLCLDNFDKLGYPAEKTNHVHGGPTGYRVSYPERCLDPLETVHSGMAFTWYLTVTGAKTEETLLVDHEGLEIMTLSNNWPLANISVEGKNIAIPDLLVKG